MTAIAAIVVPDAAATPVNKTFAPSKVDGDSARYLEKSNASPAAWPHLALTLRDPLTGTGVTRVYKQTVEYVYPITNTYTDPQGVSQTTVIRTYRAKVEKIIPEAGTLQERKDFDKLLTGILGSSQATDQSQSLDHAT